MKKRVGGNPPFGYQWLDGEFVVNRDEAPIYALMFELFLEHRRKKTIADRLNKKGYRTRSGKNWSDVSVGRLLNNPVAKGLRSYTLDRGNGAYETVTQTVEAVVSESTWNQAQEILSAPPPARIPSRDPFVGKVHCGCGNRMAIPSKGKSYICSQCESSIVIDDLTATFEHALTQMVAPAISELGNAEPSGLDASRRKRENTVTRDIEKLFELHASSAIPTEVFQARYEALQSQQNELKEVIPHTTTTPTTPQTMKDYWDHLEPGDRHQFVDTLTHGATVDKMHIRFCFYSLFKTAQQGNISGV